MDPVPLAVASVASVHKGVLLDGSSVVVKVQHENVAGLLLQDLDCLQTIGDTVKALDPDFDMSPVVREWAKELPKELDFNREASNMLRVQRGLKPYYKSDNKKLCIDVKLAKLMNEYVSDKVLIMEYIDGFKVDNQKKLTEMNVDRDALIRNVTRSYAHQIFVDGFYNGDPHPGNILIDTTDFNPVLLDFGLTKEISDEIKNGFAKMIVSAEEGDIHGLLDSFSSIGLKLRTDVSFDINLLVKYFFREAKPRNEAKKENKKRREEWKEKEELKKKTVYEKDSVDVK